MQNDGFWQNNLKITLSFKIHYEPPKTFFFSIYIRDEEEMTWEKTEIGKNKVGSSSIGIKDL